MKFYAVAKGKKNGIYTTWSDCQQQVNGYSGCLFKSFKSRIGAIEYLKENGIVIESNLRKRKREEIEIDPISKNQLEHPIKKQKVSHQLEIYTDGGCIHNGTNRAKAGVGVYFGQKDPRNISKRLEGNPQTNNRAELTAIIEALLCVKTYPYTVIIFSDSNYSINGILGRWKLKKNLDLFKIIGDLLKIRKAHTIIKKVLAHTGSRDGNYYADSLATQAIYS